MLVTALLFASLALAQDPPATPATPEATPAIVAPAPAVAPVAPEPTPAVTPAPAPAPATPPEVKVPGTEAEAVEQGAEAFGLFQAGQWGVGIALIIGVLIFVYNKFVAKKSA